MAQGQQKQNTCRENAEPLVQAGAGAASGFVGGALVGSPTGLGAIGTGLAGAFVGGITGLVTGSVTAHGYSTGTTIAVGAGTGYVLSGWQALIQGGGLSATDAVATIGGGAIGGIPVAVGTGGATALAGAGSGVGALSAGIPGIAAAAGTGVIAYQALSHIASWLCGP